MNKNEQMVSTIKTMLDKLRTEKVEFNRAIDERIAAAELMYETFGGAKSESTARKHVGRRGMRIDRQGASKTYAFLKERGDKATTPAMVARKFNISSEAASQRLLNLLKSGQVARIAKGKYLAAETITRGAPQAQA